MEDIKGEETTTESWKDIELKDVSSGETFKISDFAGKPILIESFAVWCPTCKRQQDEIKKLHAIVGDSVVSISVDTDPSENEARVLGHIERYGYDWRYAVAPGDFTQKLIDEFGINVVNAPSAPVILICEDQSTRLLSFGVKSDDTLEEEISNGC
jgi:thiol-disulfide isomerase/thioredoxin